MASSWKRRNIFRVTRGVERDQEHDKGIIYSSSEPFKCNAEACGNSVFQDFIDREEHKSERVLGETRIAAAILDLNPALATYNRICCNRPISILSPYYASCLAAALPSLLRPPHFLSSSASVPCSWYM